MDKKIGEVFQYNGVILITIEDKNNDGCKECYFLNGSICTVCNNSEIFCTASWRDDNKSVIFKKAEDMEPRTVKLTLEKAKEFYKKGGEFKDLALSAYTEKELTEIVLPKTWEEFCQLHKIKEGEYIIDGNCSILTRSSGFDRDDHFCRNILPSKEAAEAHLALIQLHQLRDYYRQGWEPDYTDNTRKYCLCKGVRYNVTVETCYAISYFLTFQTKEVAEEFLNNFRELIIKAGDLI